MPTATVRWVTGQQFVGMDSNRHAVVLSGEKEPNGLRPSQMLLIALSSCTAVDVVDILTKNENRSAGLRSSPPASKMTIRPGLIAKFI